MTDTDGLAGQPSTGDARTATLDRPVFFSSVAVLTVVLAISAIFPGASSQFLVQLQSAIVDNASWYYVLVMAIFLISVFVFAFTRYGEIKLGPDHAEPEYSLISWFSMLFAAGMGIGLMFFGVAEPVMHFLSPPLGEGGEIADAREAMKLTFLHWGLHGWAAYAIVAMVLAYFSYRHGLPLTLRSGLYPLIGDRIYGPIGTAVDVFAVVSTTFGIATSLGLGSEQINSGLNYLFDVPKGQGVQFAIIVVTTLVATVSVLLGLDAGIKRLSEVNITLAVILLVGVLIFGPTVYLLKLFMQNSGAYLADFVGMSFNVYAYRPNEWFGGWTVFYWGWWISWAPFVGLFIARISRGRTLRQFVFGVLLGPTAFTLLWMTVFGNSAIELITSGADAGLGAAVQADSSVALFRFLENFPATELLSGIAVLMVVVFFVTSADSGAMVLNMLSSKGQDNTPAVLRVFWMFAIAAAAAILMFTGGLSSLQTAVVASALPFSVAMLAAVWGFARMLSVDHAKRIVLDVGANAAPAADEKGDWKNRLQTLFHYPADVEVSGFIDSVVLPALSEFSSELAAHGVQSRVVRPHGDVCLEVLHGEEIDFTYLVGSRSHPMPDDALLSGSDGVASQHAEGSVYYRAEVHLTEGSQDYCIMSWSPEQVLQDVLEQYRKHLHFLHVLR